MQLEDYFDFADYAEFGELRIEGHRIWMHDVLLEYTRYGLTTPQALLERYPTMTMDEVLACLLYYHTHQAEMDAMLEKYLEYCRKSREDYERANAGRLADMRARMLAFKARTQAAQ